MTTRQKFKRAVIEAIHGLPYDEALLKEEVGGAKLYQRFGRKSSFPF